VIYRVVFDTVLRRISPEQAHEIAFKLLRPLSWSRALRVRVRKFTNPDDKLIRVHALGFTFSSPLGVAAGLDKNAEHFEQLGALGFGFVEIGTVTPNAQGSNPPPIIARIPGDRALLNRMGFPNLGAATTALRLQARFGETIVGANIGKNRDTDIDAAAGDYRAVARLVAAYADYVVLNVSSPNTPGLRELETVERLRPVIQAVQEELDRLGARLPLLVKISPDMSDEDLDAVADLALELGLSGIVATNTTVSRDALRTPAARVARLAWAQGGGVSGAPLKERSLAVLRRLRARVGDRLVLISVGGISSADDVWERMLAGATLVQAYTGFVYGGPGWPRKVNYDLAQRVWQSGAESIEDLIGRDTPGSLAGGRDTVSPGNAERQ
jgi:dihydroorotate dehydrogenase